LVPAFFVAVLGLVESRRHGGEVPDLPAAVQTKGE
jgi:hypothetical protein